MTDKPVPFYQQSYQERFMTLAERARWTAQELATIQQARQDDVAPLIENYLTSYALPEGVAVNLTVNDRPYLVPMVTEEPSVIAAASHGAKLLGNLTASTLSQETMGQVVFAQVAHPAQLAERLNAASEAILTAANQAHPSLATHGGGATRIRVRQLPPDWVSLDVFVATGEAMGANLVNTMMEAVAGMLSDHGFPTVLMSVLSNENAERLTRVRGRVAFDRLASGQMTGDAVAQAVVSASEFAQVDPARAATHNKGIMNGVDAAVIATGNDWRAVEAAAHTLAATNGQYHGLSRWYIQQDELVGELTLPLGLGIVGGATQVLPLAKINRRLLAVERADTLNQVVTAVGLAQNLAALHALVTDGIQQGHMRLQAKSMAMSLGATAAEIPAILPQLIALPDLNTAAVTQVITTYRQHSMKEI